MTSSCGSASSARGTPTYSFALQSDQDAVGKPVQLFPHTRLTLLGGCRGHKFPRTRAEGSGCVANVRTALRKEVLEESLEQLAEVRGVCVLSESRANCVASCLADMMPTKKSRREDAKRKIDLILEPLEILRRPEKIAWLFQGQNSLSVRLSRKRRIEAIFGFSAKPCRI